MGVRVRCADILGQGMEFLSKSGAAPVVQPGVLLRLRDECIDIHVMASLHVAQLDTAAARANRIGTLGGRHARCVRG